jgi:hypothetical protein
LKTKERNVDYVPDHGLKKMLASKIKTTYFEGANNSTPFFALVMPSGVTRSIVLLNRSFKRTSPVYD